MTLTLSALAMSADNWSWLLLDECADPAQPDGFRGQLISGWRKGYGMARLADDSYYIGLFRDNKATGSGIIVTSGENFVQNCDSTVYYAGKVVDGRPDGKGRCYNARGRLIYDGAFEKGRPTNQYPGRDISDNHRLVGIDLDDGQFLYTEAVDTVLDGMAFMVGLDQCLWIGRFRDNEVSGLSTNINKDGEWQTFFVRDGVPTPQSNSALYAEQDSELQRQYYQLKDSLRVQTERAVEEYGPRVNRLERFRRQMATACAIIGDVMNSAASIVQSFEEISGGNLGGGGMQMGSSGGGSFDYQGEYNRWARLAERHYDSLTNTGARFKNKEGEDIGGTNGQSLNAGNYMMQKKTFREAQREMKSIRHKANAAGIKIPKSRYEDIIVNY